MRAAMAETQLDMMDMHDEQIVGKTVSIVVKKQFRNEPLGLQVVGGIDETSSLASAIFIKRVSYLRACMCVCWCDEYLCGWRICLLKFKFVV